MKIVDIAAAAGVSPSTVSRVIRGSDRISPKTTALVHKAMQELGYPPIPIGGQQNLSSKSLSFIQRAVAVLTFGQEYSIDLLCNSSLFQDLSKVLASEGLSMLYHHFTKEDKTLCPWMHFVSGAIILRGRPYEKVASWFENRPHVTVNSSEITEGDHLISGQNQVGQLAADYLYKKGIRHFASLNVLPEFSETKGQIEGFDLFLKEHHVKHYDKLSVDRSTPLPTKKTIPAIENRIQPMVEQLLQQGQDDPLGLFVPNDWITAMVYRQFYLKKQSGFCNWTLISVGNVDSALCGLYPRPATIDIGLDSIGRNAVNLLLMRIHANTPHQPLQIAIRPKIVPGDMDI